MEILLAGLAPIGAFALVMGAVIAWDRLREPHRQLRRPFAIGGPRDYRDACRRINRLAAQGDWRYAHLGAVAICTWLRAEQHYGRRRRRQQMAANLATWTARGAEFNPR